MTLNDKTKAAQLVIKEAYERHGGNIFLSFSGGKDSTVLRHIALSLYPDLNVVFSNTTNELKEVLAYVRSFENVIHVKPKLSFSQVVEKYGFPAVSKEVSQKINELKNTQGETTRNTRLNGDSKGNGIVPAKWRFLAEQEFNVTHKCCKILKKDPLEKWASENSMVPIIALMADESALRKQLALYGEDSRKIYPFLKTGWTEADIWEYAKINNIRFAECYYDSEVNGMTLKARSRTGCEFCAFGIHLESEDRFVRSRLLSPKRYEKMMLLENNGVKFFEIIELVKRDVLPVPVLDLYGIKINKGVHNNIAKNFFIQDRHETKKCSCCGSKDIQKIETYQQSYFDAPEKNGMTRKLWAIKEKFKCNNCDSVFTSKTPMVNEKLGVTERLIDYIDQNKSTKSFNDVMNETHLSFGKATQILRYVLRRNINI